MTSFRSTPPWVRGEHGTCGLGNLPIWVGPCLRVIEVRADACRALETATAVPRSVRIQVPRMIVALCEIRNNRNVGHVGGDLSPNLMDATVVLAMSRWIVAELIRIFHGTDPDTARLVVEALVEREVPVVWAVGDRRRILDASLSRRDQLLLLAYSSSTPVSTTTLAEWIENERRYLTRDVIRPLHAARLVEYDAATAATRRQLRRAWGRSDRLASATRLAASADPLSHLRIGQEHLLEWARKVLQTCSDGRLAQLVRALA